MERRNFLKSSIALSAALAPKAATADPSSPLKVIVLNTDWGWRGSLEALLEKSKAAGYAGIETWWTPDQAKTKALMDALQKYEMEVGFLAGSGHSDYAQHKAAFETAVVAASTSSTQRALYINCHSGKDFFTSEQNSALVQFTLAQAVKSGVAIYHETHRSRMCYSLPITHELLKSNPGMQLTLDASHWTTVHESMLHDQEERLAFALQNCGHIHARIGHPEGPQVNDPRAPEWKRTVERFLEWWDQVVKNRVAKGEKSVTFLTEFGPPNYLPTLPYTQQPVADQWAINEYMLELISARYGRG